MKKSITQTTLDTAKCIINVIVSTVSNPENLQMYIVKEFFKAYHKNDMQLAYDIANESFNQSFIAGYKYLELCELSGHKGEFFEIAQKNPLINL